MPTGCGTWPAYWLCGDNWPNNGEIDIIEGVNTQNFNQMTLHSKANCNMNGVPTSSFSGKWSSGSDGKPTLDCDVNAPH